MEAQIMEIQYTLDNSEIVDDDSISIDEVGLGSTIKVKNFRTGKIETLQIVSSNEANFKEGKISDESPSARALSKESRRQLYDRGTCRRTEVRNSGNQQVIQNRYRSESNGKSEHTVRSGAGTGQQCPAPDSSG
ncbi:MAG: GreA/GreB family elongation factor [Ruminococcus sp.]